MRCYHFSSQSLKSVFYSQIWKTEKCDILRILAHTSRTSSVYFTQKVLAFFPGRWKEISFWHWPEHTMEDKLRLVLTPSFALLSPSPEPDKLVYLKLHVRQTSKASPNCI